MKKQYRQPITICLLFYIILNMACQALDPIAITKFSPLIEYSDVSYNSAAVTSKFMDIGGDVTSYGHCWDTLQNPTIDNSKTVYSDTPEKQVEFTSELTDLRPKTKYYVRSYAYDVDKLIYGAETSFTTQPNAPVVTALNVTLVTESMALLQGTVNAKGLSTNVIFWYGETIDYGEDEILPGKVNGDSISNVSVLIKGLTKNTSYHYRISAISIGGAAQSEDISFTTPPLLTDVDGNEYKTVIIGTQIWMAENMKYLPAVVGSGTFSYTSPYYYVYDYNGTNVMDAKATSNYVTYGALYNWTAAMNGEPGSSANPSGVQGVCPTGWHLPSFAEWTQLFNYYGGEDLAGGPLKETGTAHWDTPNYGATNESGFTALPGGYRDYDAAFYSIIYMGFWWSTEELGSEGAWVPYINYGYGNIWKMYGRKELGLSVRCVKD